MDSRTRTLPLSDGSVIPQIGLGVWQMTEDEAEAAVLAARSFGYVLIDTAAGYENERAVGRAVDQFDRSEVYLTSKLKNDDQGLDSTRRAFDDSMSKLGIDVLDLYLIHWPSPSQDKYVDSWRALIELQREGRITSIGVSNFEPHHLTRLIEETGVVPVVNQIELHPLFAQRSNRQFHVKHGIVTEAWSPLGSGRADVLEAPKLIEIARRNNVTVAQTVLAWHLAIGNVVIPKSVTPERIRENLGSLDVELTPGEIDVINSLDDGTRFGPHPDEF